MINESNTFKNFIDYSIKLPISMLEYLYNYFIERKALKLALTKEKDIVRRAAIRAQIKTLTHQKHKMMLYFKNKMHHSKKIVKGNVYNSLSDTEKDNYKKQKDKAKDKIDDLKDKIKKVKKDA